MREPESCQIDYCGYANPRSPDEIEFEILGLEVAMNEMKKRIAILRQSSYLVKMKLEAENDCSNSQK